MYENQYFCKNLNIQESPSAYHPNGQIIRILLFLNPIPVHHPDIFLAVDNHMVYHADPQLFIKLSCLIGTDNPSIVENSVPELGNAIKLDVR